MGNAVFRLKQPQLVHHRLEQVPVFCPVNAFRRSTDDGDPGFVQPGGQVQRCLAAELDNDPEGFFLFHYVDHIFVGQGFKVEFVGCVIVCGHGFRIGIDHDGFHPFLFQRKRGMHAAVVKFNPLADAVGTASQDDHLFFVTDPGFAFGFIGGIIIRGDSPEFRGTGVHQFVHRHDT